MFHFVLSVSEASGHYQDPIPSRYFHPNIHKTTQQCCIISWRAHERKSKHILPNFTPKSGNFDNRQTPFVWPCALRISPFFNSVVCITILPFSINNTHLVRRLQFSNVIMRALFFCFCAMLGQRLRNSVTHSDVVGTRHWFYKINRF